MAACTYPASYSSGGSRFNPVPLVAVAVLVLAAVAVINSVHAVARHGSEAEAIRKCLGQNGAYQIYKDRAGDFYKLCKLDDGRWGAQIIAKQADEFFEKTAYVKGDGAWNTVMRWLVERGATRWTGQIP